MLRYIIIFNAFCALCSVSVSVFMVDPGPMYPPTKGEVWPRPQLQVKKTSFYTVDPAHITVNVVGHKCFLVTSTINRYVYAFRHYSTLVTAPSMRRTKRRGRLEHRGALRTITVDLTKTCEEYPHFGMDESYNLTVTSTATLRSSSVWGIMRGFETLFQLVYLSDDYDELRINKTQIIDFPRYSHRGLLLDTSRHFISLENILLTLDAMAMNKMNVFHWHIVDDQSFPYQSEKFPELSQRGAYHRTMVYTKADITFVVNYARERGIRVIPEIDVPGHTRSWGISHPDILTKCYRDNKVVGLGPMDPTNNATYELLGDLIKEVQEWFPDKYYHIGGDEVDLDCWASNPTLLDYMAQHNISSVEELHALFMTRVIPLLGDRSQPIVWQEVFDEDVPISQGTLVQIWKGGYELEINKVLLAGHKVLFSAAWYLDHFNQYLGGDWEKYYKVDPVKFVTNASLARNVVGGEACMWGETVDDRNVLSRVWPRASAVAEVLWSASIDDMPSELSRARPRLEEHTCRMIRHRIPAQPPNGPGYCVT